MIQICYGLEILTVVLYGQGKGFPKKNFLMTSYFHNGAPISKKINFDSFGALYSVRTWKYWKFNWMLLKENSFGFPFVNILVLFYRNLDQKTLNFPPLIFWFYFTGIWTEINKKVLSVNIMHFFTRIWTNRTKNVPLL